jgi:hypothetical protein
MTQTAGNLCLYQLSPADKLYNYQLAIAGNFSIYSAMHIFIKLSVLKMTTKYFLSEEIEIHW